MSYLHLVSGQNPFVFIIYIAFLPLLHGDKTGIAEIMHGNKKSNILAVKVLTSTWYYWGPYTLGLETGCVCMWRGIILALRKEIQMIQKHRRKKWVKIYICTKSAISGEKSLKFEEYQQKYPY